MNVPLSAGCYLHELCLLDTVGKQKSAGVPDWSDHKLAWETYTEAGNESW
jgi:hypothetical protein